MKVYFNNFVNSVSPVSFKGDGVSNQNKVDMSAPQDTFVRSAKTQDVYTQKLNALFPNGALDKIYAQIGKELGIDVLPTLKFYGPSDNVMAGGFTFSKNEIALSLGEIFNFDKKVVMVKNGRYLTLVAPQIGMPMFADKASCEMVANANRKNIKKIADDVKVVSMTDDDYKKFVIHKLYHELIHAQQHMIMRSTEGIGEKEITKAWTHIKPKNEAEEKKLTELTEKLHKDSYWADKTPTVQKHSKDSEQGKLAYTFLEAVRNYPPVGSPEYHSNALEADAYKRSYEYLTKNFGSY